MNLRKPMTDNDPRCAECGLEEWRPAHRPVDPKYPAPWSHAFKPQPAPPSGLTAEQRATDFIRRTLAYCNEKLSDEAVTYLASEVVSALAEIDRLAKLVNDQNGTLAAFADRAVKAEAERDALKAENERLRATQCAPDHKILVEACFNYQVREDALRALVAEKDAALRPFASFVEKWNAKPLRGADRQFYTIHTGTEWEAALSLDDCERARAALAKGEKK